MDLARLETITFWANIAVVVGSIVAAFAAAFALYFNLKLSAAKDAAPLHSGGTPLDGALPRDFQPLTGGLRSSGRGGEAINSVCGWLG